LGTISYEALGPLVAVDPLDALDALDALDPVVAVVVTVVCVGAAELPSLSLPHAPRARAAARVPAVRRPCVLMLGAYMVVIRHA
jgi:hypothetical protein